MEDLNKALEVNPKLEWILMERGDLHREAGRFDEALADYTAVIANRPAAAAAYRRRGNVYEAKSDPAKASLDYDKAAELEQKVITSDASRNKGARERAARKQEAERHLTERVNAELEPLRSRKLDKTVGPYLASVAKGATKRFQFNLAGGAQYAFVAICEQGCSEVSMQLHDEKSALLAQSSDKAPAVIIGGTPPVDGVYAVNVSVPGCGSEECFFAIAVAGEQAPVSK